MPATTTTNVPTYTDEEIRQHREQFLAALRSGEYPQTTDYLRTPEGFCCLGVAETLAGTPVENIDEFGRYAFKDDQFPPFGNKVALTPNGRAWLGAKGSDPHIDERCVSFWNDEEGLSFPEIADKFATEWGLE